MPRRTEPDLAGVADALYRARSSATWERLMKPLTPSEIAEVQKRVGERINAEKARFQKLFADVNT